MSKELSIIPDSKELVRQSTDIAGLCREIVLASSVEIDGRKYVRVEGWQAIATAHGCVASARDVRKVDGGMIATGEIRRMQDGGLIATAEGFVGEDEPTWYGGETIKDEWKGGRKTGQKITKTMAKRPEYAIRAMVQTRAISRACRGCFAHVVVLMKEGLSTTPAEEVPDGGFNDSEAATPSSTAPKEQTPEQIEQDRIRRVGKRHAAMMESLPVGNEVGVWVGNYIAEAANLTKRPDEIKTLSDMSKEELIKLAEQHPNIVTKVTALVTA